MKLPNFNIPKTPGFVIAGIVVLLAILGLYGFGKIFLSSNNPGSTLANGFQKVELPAPTATQTINKELSFPLKDDKGKELARVKYIIEKAELMDQIIVKGKKASSVNGRTFLILSVKLANELDKPIAINTGDYVRLVNPKNNNEQLAPDLHNDPVTVQALSTKFTKVGFAVDEGLNQFTLKIGELTGDKQTLEIKF